jgi:sugar phosphate isomerase/epimerase
MRLAVSNIAWPAEAEPLAADLLARLGVRGVEIAPTKVWPHPLEAGAADIVRYRAFWEDRGIRIVAMQALLFERPELRIFAGPDQRAQALAYLRGILRLAGLLGVEALVFGSPRNRQRAPRTTEEVYPEAVTFFRTLGEVAVEYGTTLCLEPNPKAYGCDFVTNVTQGLALVRAVDHPGFQLHLDTGALCLSGDVPGESFRAALPWWRHFHVSEPFLAPVGTGPCDHQAIAAGFRESGYDRWVSIEMKASTAGFAPATLEHAVRLVTSHYGVRQEGNAAA